MAIIYAKAAALCGASGIFAEIYKNPEKALSDSSTSLCFNQFEELVGGVDKLMRKK